MTNNVSDFDKQDIRFAVVMNGGVSLAIWISGVTLELHHMAQAGKNDGPEYRRIADELLKANVRVDVIAGTSAGGLNGAFLALGLAGGGDLVCMRGLWTKDGDLKQLLRHPLAKNPPSLLQGDDYFLGKLTEAFAEVFDSSTNGFRAGKSPPSPVELILTGTLWDGRMSSFTDDMGANIAEHDYDATFHFTSGDGRDTPSGNLDDHAVINQLARAARCTSSFPGAFEPYLVSVGPADDVCDGRWPSSAGRVNFSRSQYVVDGGVLLNKPLRPALEAIYRQPAERQVRRVLAYVSPTPGEQSADTAVHEAPTGGIPGAGQVVLDVFTRLRSTDSVSRELAEIRDRNELVKSRRRARDRLASAMTGAADPLAEAAWEGYLEVRLEHAARTITELMFVGQTTGSEQRWSRRELIEAFRELKKELSLIPQSATLAGALDRSRTDWASWGPTAVQRLGDMSRDVLKRAIWLAPLSTRNSSREKLVSCLQRLYNEVLSEIYADRRALDGYWPAAARGNSPFGARAIPARVGPANAPATNLGSLNVWLSAVVGAWDKVTRPPSTEPVARRLYEHALALARRLRTCAAAIEGVCKNPNKRLDPDGDEMRRLKALHGYLLADAKDDAEVLQRMLRLDVVQLAFGGATGEVEQQVELVQVSCLDPGHLTGQQAHHFGAFYRPSWRMNDWLHGRVDGASHIVRILLSPERLRQLGTRPEEMLDVIRTIAVPEHGHLDHQCLADEWNEKCDDCLRELMAVADENGPLPKTLPTCVEQIARRIQTRILREDLPELARAIREETGTPPASSGAWLSSYNTATRGDKVFTTAELWRLWEDAAQIGLQRIHDEVGGDTLARTITHTAAVASNMVGTPSHVKIVDTLLRVVRGYTLIVWAMVLFLTTRSNLATSTVNIAVAAGGTLLATAVLVPGIPLGLILAGVLLVLASATAAALRAPERGARKVGIRLLISTLIAITAISLYTWMAWQSIAQKWAPLANFLIALLIILLGLFVAGTRSPEPGRRSEHARKDDVTH